MKQISINTAEAKDRFSEVLNDVHYSGKQYLITSHGKPKALITAADPQSILKLSEPSAVGLAALSELEEQFGDQFVSTEHLTIPQPESDDELPHMS